jgi:hypothetical protein
MKENAQNYYTAKFYKITVLCDLANLCCTAGILIIFPNTDNRKPRIINVFGIVDAFTSPD